MTKSKLEEDILQTIITSSIKFWKYSNDPNLPMNKQLNGTPNNKSIQPSPTMTMV